MAKKSPQIVYRIPSIVLFLIVLECAVTLFVVLRMQTQIEHEALMNRIGTLKAVHQQIYSQPEMPIDKNVTLP